MKNLIKCLVIIALFTVIPFAAEAQTQLRDGRAVNGNMRKGATVSYIYTPTADGYLIINTTGNTDIFLEVFEGNNKIEENHNDGEGNNAQIIFQAKANQAYRIDVKGASDNTSGRFNIIATIDTVRLQKELQEQRELEARLLREQEELADQKRGYINLYSDIAGTILVNGVAREETVIPESEALLIFDDALNKEFTLAVREINGTVRQATKIRIDKTGSQNVYNVSVTGPNAPEDFDIVQTATGITITRYKGTRTRVVIPQTLHGQRVTIIGEKAFDSDSINNKLISVQIPNTITSIGENAFRGQSLNELVIPSSLTTIGKNAFSGCKIANGELVIPDTVTTIGEDAFNNCKLIKVRIGRGVKFIDKGAFHENPIEEFAILALLPAFDGRSSTEKFYTETVAAYNQTVGLSPYIFSSSTVWNIWAGGSLATPKRLQSANRVTLSANIHDDNLRAFPEGLVGFYKSQGKRAGTYVLNGQIWTRE